MKKTKKIISLLLTILMIITALPLTAVESFAADVVKSGTTGECTWTLDSDGVLTISGNGKMKDYYTPWGESITKVIIENGGTSIGRGVFFDCTSLEEINVGSDNANYSSENGILFNKAKTELIKYPAGKTEIEYIIPDSVTSIGDYAFRACTSLTSITIPDSVTSIATGICYKCTSLETAKIETPVLPPDTFADCTSLKKVILGDNVKEIYGEGPFSGAFSGCTALESVKIPAGVISIRPGAFYRCTSLTNIDVPNDNKYYSSLEGILFNKDKTEILCYPLGKTELTYSIPNGITSIGDYAFYACNALKSVTIPYGVTSIGISAFGRCTSITNATIPDSVTHIGWGAFDGCTSLTSITIPDGVTSIDDTFSGTAYYNDESNWDNGILYIGNHLVNTKRDVEGDVVIKEGTKTINSILFCNMDSLTSITIPESVTTLGDSFHGCTALTRIKVSSKNKCYSSLDGVLFNKDKTELLCYPIGKTDPTYSIPNSVTSIEHGAFESCASLTSITIPDSVTSIGTFAFSNTAYYNDESNWDNGILYIGNHLIDAKEGMSGSIEIKQGTKAIADWAFGDTSFESVTIPDSVTSIGDYAFVNCNSLHNIVIPDSVTSIGFATFANCNSLHNIVIPNNITSIGDQAFNGCSALTNITIPDSVTSIGGWAFANCTSLTSVTIPDGVTSIGDDAFDGCTSLKGIVIPESVTEIGEQALGYYWNHTGYMSYKIEDFVIYGKAGSEAERYANENEFKFVQAGDAPTMTFPDVRSGDWYYDAVKFNFERGYITGYSNGTFGPANNIQRQDFALILARIAGADLSAYEGQNGGFSDVPSNEYYSAAVAWAKDRGIVTGYSADNFGVGTYISREQICLIFSRYFDGEATGDVDAIVQAYPDGGNTSPWAKAGVAWAIENGIVGNAGYINPIGNAGRAEVAQIIYNMANKGMI